MRKFMAMVMAGVAGCASIPMQARAQAAPEAFEHQDQTAPGFADFLAVDGKTVWATNRGRVEQWSRTGKLAEVPMTHPCGAMAIVGNDMWVADCEERTLNKIDMRAAKVTAVVHSGIASPKGETAVVFGAGSIWAASDAKGVIARVDPATNSVIASIAVDPDTYYLAYAFGALWAVSDSHQSIQKIDPATNTVVKRTPLGQQSSFMAVSDKAVWVIEQGDGTVARIDSKSGEVTGRVKVGDALKFADIDAGGGKVWVRTRVDQVFVVIDPKSATIKARVGASMRGGGLRWSPEGLWTSEHDLNLLSWWPHPEKIGN